MSSIELKGKWTVEGGGSRKKIYVANNESRDDVWLLVTGNFESIEHAKGYAEEIARRLNDADKNPFEV